MPNDTVRLEINQKRITGFKNYEIDSSILTPADAFSCTLGGIDGSIKGGENFELYINNKKEMTGVIDKPNPSYSRTESETKIVGRDLMGLLIDNSVEPEHWKTLKEISIDAMARRLLKSLPHFADKKIVVGTPSSNAPFLKVKKTSKKIDIFGDTKAPVVQFSPGQSIFEALSNYAQRQGLIFWMAADGTLIFDTPQWNDGVADFHFYNLKNGTANNIKSASLMRDISKMYKKITVQAQLQGSDMFSVGDHDVLVSAVDPDFPFYKHLVIQSESNSKSAAKKQVKWEMAKRQADGWRLKLTVAGHSQGENNYRQNSICYVKDEDLNLDGNYLILGRTFKRSRRDGTTTDLVIGKLMEGYSVV